MNEERSGPRLVTQSNVIELAKRKPRKPVESDIVVDIRVAAAKIPWVTLWRNNTGVLEDVRGRPVKFGLCEGSSDLIGIVECPLRDDSLPTELRRVPVVVGRFVAIEVKQPGKKPTPDQLRFLDVVKSRGGAATWVTSVADAVAWLERVRRFEE